MDTQPHHRTSSWSSFVLDSADASARRRTIRGFTLIELLLVVVIILIASALAVPRFIRSYKGAKLRTSMRTVVMTTRYARGVAVLQQKQMAILFDQAKNNLEVVSISAPMGNAEGSQFLDQRVDTETAGVAAGSGDGDSPFQVQTELTRELAGGVRIHSVEIDKKGQEHDGIYWVNFYPNGMCDKYQIQLMEEDHHAASMKVDPLSGTAKVEYEQ